LAKSGIAAASPTNFSFVVARWQHRTDELAVICNCMFWLKFDPRSPAYFLEVRDPSNTMRHWTL